MNKKIIQRISLLILLFVLPIAYPVTDIHAQDVRVTIRMEKVRMEQVMNEIERQTKYLFGSAENVDVKRIVTVQVVNRPLQEALDAMLRGTNVSYTVQGSNIVLKNGRSEAEAKKPAVISGVVRDAAGNPVVGAAVVVKGTTIGISTDSEGRFSLQVPPPASQAVLEINYLGYAPADVRVGSATRFDITLKEDSQQISDVLVVGYTPMRKSDFTGSIASVKASELTTTTPTMAQALAGKVAGVEVRQADGAPGEGVQIRVRGVNSLSAGSDPLYVVDGYPASEDVYINPGDIESIDILKDAASAAIYGSRGASGVVLITTKRGKEGERAKISYDFSYGIQQLERKVDLLDANQFRDLYIASRNDSYRRKATAAGIAWSPNDDNTIRSAKGFSLADVGIHPMFYDFTTRTPVEQQYNTDWQDEVFGNAGMMRHNISVTGGSKAIRYMASVGYMDQDGIIAPSNHNRINARLNLDAQITKHFSASLSYSMYDVKNKVVQAEGRMINDGVIQSMLMYLPNLPAYEENGDYARSAMIRMVTDWGINFPENPLVIANELDISEKTSRHNLNFNLVYEPLPDLKISARLGQQWYNYRYFYYRPMSIGRNSTPAYGPELASYNIARSSSTYDIDRLGEFTASYKKQLGRHHVDALIGYTLQRKTYDRLGVQATGFADDRIHEVTAHGPKDSDVSLYETRKAAWSMMSYLARLNYSFDDRYTVTGTFRTDGSSRFGVNNRWGYFPSASLAWRVSGEDFFTKAKFLSFVDDLKIRTSYGVTGNFQIGNYDHLSLMALDNYILGTGNGQLVQGYKPNTIKNDDLSWEKNAMVNVGVDLQMFKGLLGITVDYYNTNTSNMLLNVPVPHLTGYSTALMNIGKVNNRGWEIALTSQKNFTKDFGYSFNANYATNTNEVKALGPGNAPIISTGSVDHAYYITKVGEPIGCYYLLVQDGIFSNEEELKKYPHFSNTQPGDFRFVDVDGDGVMDLDKDRTIVGNYMPDFTYGFGGKVWYKGIDLDFNFQGVYGNEILNLNRRYIDNLEGNTNGTTIALNRWKSADNPGNGQVNRANRKSKGYNGRTSTWHLEDGSYLRLQNVTLGYTLPQNLTRRFFVEKLRVYVSGTNLLTWSKLKHFDPEMTEGSGSYYPQQRTFNIGASITF